MRKVLVMLYVVLVFAVGFLVGQVWDSVFYGGITGRVIDSPSDFVDDRNINIYSDRVVIEVEGAKLSTYDSTGSMLPTLGSGVNGISVIPKLPDEISVGDIVSFRKGELIIVHRVVQKGNDENGIYFVTKGDNSPTDDGKIRFEEIEHVLVALVY